ncbi:MAG: glycosyltransferase [Patescibacteria group bacterium]
MPVKNLSVFFPLYNEEGNVQQSVEKAISVLNNLKIDYEILLIDDGSSDKTGQIADRLSEDNPKIKVIHHEKNLGYGEALKSGFYNAKYDTVCYTDGDRQFDFAEVEKFLEKIEEHDLILGYRIKRQDPYLRILFKKGWKASLFIFFGLTFRDVDCGFKMIKKNVLEKIPHLESTRGAMINAELAIKVKKAGFKIAQVGVSHYPRLSGKPTGATLTVIIRSYVDLLRLWWKLKDQKFLFLLLIGVLVLAAFFRLYRIDEYMLFLGDEGRDVLIVQDMVKGKNFPAIGPPSSVGNIYLGPLYYYMMFIPMVLTNLNPVSASVMNALIGVTCVFLIYYFGKVWFGRMSGLIASFFYAISPVTINYSNFSWNPNPTPFFALLAVLGFYKAHSTGNSRWLILTGASAAAALQMHYLALILLPILGIFWIFEFITKKGRYFWQGTVGAVVVFLVVMSPLLMFDLKHNFLNYRAIREFFTTSNAVSGNIFENFKKIPQIFSENLIGRYMAGENMQLALILSILILLALFRKSWPTFALGVWLIVGLLGVSFYQKDIYDHYLGFLNPVPFLLFGSLATLKISKKFKTLILGLLIITLIFLNLEKSPLKNPPNNQLGRAKDVAKFIIEQSEYRPFNFALLAERNYDPSYQFYLDEFGHKPQQLPFTKTDQLFVVCEDPVCNPVGHPKQEISHFGWAIVEKEWEVNGVRIYKLIHNPEELKVKN